MLCNNLLCYVSNTHWSHTACDLRWNDRASPSLLAFGRLHLCCRRCSRRQPLHGLPMIILDIRQKLPRLARRCITLGYSLMRSFVISRLLFGFGLEVLLENLPQQPEPQLAKSPLFLISWLPAPFYIQKSIQFGGNWSTNIDNGYGCPQVGL